MRHTAKPFLPTDAARPGLYLERALYASALSAASSDPVGGPAEIARKRWGDGLVVGMLTRGAVDPADTSTSGWASQLAGSAVRDYVATLAPISAAAKLLGAALRVSLAGKARVLVPRREGALDAASAAWVAEGAPQPVKQYTINGDVALGPTKKVVAQIIATRELLDYTPGEKVLTAMMREAIAFALDAALFCDDAVSDAKPAGLSDGIDGLTAASGGGTSALVADLEQLADAIADSASGVVFVTHPAQAFQIKIRLGTVLPGDVQVWPTIGVQRGVVIALDPTAVASGFGPEPEIKASRETALVMQDTAPPQFAEPGTPAVVGAPALSLFQADLVALRLALRAAWTWRAIGAVAWLENANWGPAA